jgi:hypothetical protein
MFTPPERRPFKTPAGSAVCNSLNFGDFDIRTKPAVVRLRQRKGPGEDGKRPEEASLAGAGGSDTWPRSPKFCAVPAGAGRAIENVPNG